MTFRIVHSKGNKDNSLPEHHDIFLEGSDDQIATIWAGEDMTKEFVKFLEQYPARSKKAKP